MDWSEEVIGRLRSLWAEGHSTAEIGRRLGVSKNAVVGKAHRLNLSARPSPIRRDQSAVVMRPAAPRRITGTTLPPLPGPPLAGPPTLGPTADVAPRPPRALPVVPLSAQGEPATPAAAMEVARVAPAPAVASPAVLTEAVLPPAPEPRAVKIAPAPRAPALHPVTSPRGSSRVSACCWPIGEPGKPSFRFCDGEAMSGKPYCAEHAQLAYVKIRDRREEAA